MIQRLKAQLKTIDKPTHIELIEEENVLYRCIDSNKLNILDRESMIKQVQQMTGKLCNVHRLILHKESK